MDIELLLRLNQIPHLGGQRLITLLQQVKPDFWNTCNNNDLYTMGWSEQQIQRWHKPSKSAVEPALRWLEKENNQLITYFDCHYPYQLKQIGSPPLLLFVQGDIRLLEQPQIAIIGSRYCSDYGEYWSKYFASQLAMQGLVITSGMALGIDSFSHQAALDVKGKTIAVLGSGCDHIYPKRNLALAQEIIEQGALISEFLPNQPPLAQHFPRRNRIISGLSLGTLVIEADCKSGSLITARYALEQNREVFALPGALQNQFSRGCHALIKQGAMLVENCDDILDNLNCFISRSHDEMPSIKPSEYRDSQHNESNTVDVRYPNLYKHIGFQVINADDLAELTGLTIQDVLTQLVELELDGVICHRDGGYCRP